MKLLVEYKDEELAVLSDEDRQSLFLIECAERGVPLPGAIPEFISSPESRDDLQPDTTVYKLGSRYSSESFFFASAEKAQEVVDTIVKNQTAVKEQYRSGRDNLFIVGAEEPKEVEIQAVAAYTNERYSKLKDEIDLYDRQKKRIDENNDRRQKIIDQHAKVMSDIDDAIATATKNVTKVAEFGQLFVTDLGMANNDHTVAVRFLLNAHYNSISEYDNEKLAKIGITKEDINAYIEASKPKEEE